MSAPAAPADGSAAVDVATAPRGSANRIILILSVCGFASTFAMRFVDPMIGVIARDLAADPHDVALLSSAFALPYAFVQPVLGPVGDALGKVRIIKICLVLLAIALAAATLTGDLRSLMVLRILSGMAAGGVIPLALATIGDRVPMEARQVAISRFLLFTISGQLLGGVVSGVLAATIGWRGAFGLAATLAGIAAGSSILALPGAAAGRFTLATAVERYVRILSIGHARALFAFVFVEGALVFGVQPYLAPLLEERSAGGAREAGFLIASFAVGGIVYALSVRALLRLFGLRRMLVLAGGLGLLAYGLLAARLPWQAEAGGLLALGVGFYMLHNSLQTQVTEVVSDARASAVSLHAFSYFAGQAIGPALFGVALGTIGETATDVTCGIGFLLLALTGASVLTRAQSRAA